MAVVLWTTIARMTPNEALRLAADLMSGRMVPEEFARFISAEGTLDIGVAQLDLDRQRRCGFPEVVFAENKPADTLRAIVASLLSKGVEVLATRVSPSQAGTLQGEFPRGRYNAIGRTYRISPDRAAGTDVHREIGRVVVVTAGTSDLPVAEEALETLRWMGVSTHRITDVGVAGPQRLLARLPEIQGADAVIVIAGMEGALPSVVGGHVDCPVIAVPTSVGYGANLGGIAPLLSMLNSCAANVTVVNIDAGFKGAYVAGMIARNSHRARCGDEHP